MDMDVVSSSPETSQDTNQETTTTTTESEPTTSNERPKTSSVHLTVHRAEISSTIVEEGNQELEELDVEVYDQNTYEKGVFEQCNKALTLTSSTNCDQPATSSISKLLTSRSIPLKKTADDLIRLTQEADLADDEDQCQQVDKDLQILELTRLQRLNKANSLDKSSIKTGVCPQIDVNNLPRIPRLSKKQASDGSTTRSQPLRPPRPSKSTESFTPKLTKSFTPKPTLKRKTITVHKRIKSEPPDSASGDDSDVSEYRPAADEGKSTIEADEDEEDFDEDNIEYEESDSDDQQDDDTRDDIETTRRKRKVEDDGDFKSYQARVKAFTRAKAQARLLNIADDGTELKNLDETVQIEGELLAPKELWDNLFEHQKIGVRWLWELHQLGTGGILGDEMGLGKTIQMIAFLTALKTSNIVNAHMNYDNLGPTILVCPATVMHQWLMEFRKWWPPFRVAILHNTGSFSGNRKDLVQVINKSRGVLIVSYPGVVIYQDYLHAFNWHYAILDEGHKIRNPDAQVTLACKRFRTPHRLILSGSPVQNNLKELWSIFDFIYPGKLGTLPVFMEQFAIPITQGGYANASDIQVQIAYKCSCVLRDTIKPFLLRRTKAEVNSRLKLPDRSEQVLFCKLTEKQRKSYQAYLESPVVRDIKSGNCQIFVGLTALRKICNHPDLFDSTECQDQIKQLREAPGKKNTQFFSVDETFGHYKKSGKMMVVDALLKLWKSQGHKVLLFTQSRQMLKIFIDYLNERDYKHMVMDGSTPIISRQTMIEEYNKNEEIFVFLLTTRVGGVGVNLTGANRIIIYDPDWNPSTDIQARERAWRIGQLRHVIIYRLLTAGTIEEKIYHRQVFKLYLTNRILKDAKQKRFFKTNDMHELFALGDDEKNIQTKALFDENLQISLDSIRRSKKHEKSKRKERKKRRHLNDDDDGDDCNENAETNGNLLSEEKLKAMREQAKRISNMIAQQFGDKSQQQEQQQQEQEQKTNSTNQQQLDKEPQATGQVRIKIEPGCEPAESLNCSSNDLSSNCPPVKVKVEPIWVDPNRTPPHDEFFTDEQPVELRKVKRESTSNNNKSKSKKSGKNKHSVDYLVKQEVYRSGDVESSAGDSKKESKRYKEDDYILERLFKNSNIFGALKHDRIETDSTSDFKVVESEADKVARDAIRALKESRRMCLDSRTGVPNWTGKFGQVAAKPRLMPKNKSRAQFMMKAGQSSSCNDKLASGGGGAVGGGGGGGNSLLTAIKQRNQFNPVALARAAFSTPLDSDEEEEKDKDFEGKAKEVGAEGMADKVRDYILFKSARSGEAQTDDLLEFFKANFNPDKTAIFKALLYKMCKFDRRGDKGFWILNSEFREM